MSVAGPILDRPLEPEWLDAALRIARAESDPDAVRRHLRVLLDGAGLGTTARIKTITTLVRVWADPPADAAEAIAWARRELGDADDLRAVHFAALLATYPFFGDVCTEVGRVLALEEEVNTPDIRARLRASWGDRRSVHNAVQRSIKTLRAFGVLTGSAGTSVSRRGLVLPASPNAGRFLVHALLLTRGAQSIDEREVGSAPELFGLELPKRFEDAYHLLERHREGGGRTVLAVV